MSEVPLQMDADHSLSIQNYERTYALALQVAVTFIPICFFMYIYIMTADNNTIFKKYALFFCVAFGVVFLVSLLIMLHKKKSYLLILKEEEIIIDNKSTRGIKRSIWRTNEVSRVYSMVLPMFLRNYTRKYGKILFINPFYLIFISLFLISSILIKYVASVACGFNFTIYNNYVLIFEDGSYLNIALSRADDKKIFEKYIRINAWEDKLSKKYCLTPTSI